VLAVGHTPPLRNERVLTAPSAVRIRHAGVAAPSLEYAKLAADRGRWRKASNSPEPTLGSSW
jgi:hypothetical protein